MRSFLYLAAVPLAVGLGACTINVPTNPNTFSVEPSAVSHLRGSQAVALNNAYSGEANKQFRIGSATLVLDEKKLTDTAIEMLSRAMGKQGITRLAQAQKTITLRVRTTFMGMRGIAPVPQRSGRLVLDARFGDGTHTSIEAENSSPGDFDRVFDGAVLFALKALLADEKFVTYMNR